MTSELVLIHGRGFKPEREGFEALWFETLDWGLSKVGMVPNFASRTLLYYGDLSNRFLGPPVPCDLAARRAVFERLQTADFERFIGDTAYGMQEIPDDIQAYFQRDSWFSKALRERVLETLENKHRLVVFAHSLGSVLAVDALSELKESCSVELLITAGSPLTHQPFLDNCVGKPRNVGRWVDLRARGDLICAEPRLADHFGQVEQVDLVNPALRDGLPDPHHALGYLGHPVSCRLLGKRGG